MERPSDEIASKVEEVKTGNSTVVETGHTVIMNWNAQLVPLLKQLAVAKAERPGTFDAPIVILANVDKAAMDETIAEELADSPPLDVVTRQGDPSVAEDLSRVNAFAARRVVVLHPESAEDYDGDGIEATDLSGEIDAARIRQLKDPRESVSELSKRQQLEEANKATVVMNLRGAGAHDRGGGGANPELIVQMPYRVAEASDLVEHAMARIISLHRTYLRSSFVSSTYQGLHVRFRRFCRIDDAISRHRRDLYSVFIASSCVFFFAGLDLIFNPSTLGIISISLRAARGHCHGYCRCRCCCRCRCRCRRRCRCRCRSSIHLVCDLRLVLREQVLEQPRVLRLLADPLDGSFLSWGLLDNAGVGIGVDEK